ncbi:MAG: M16 family metallopeptidase [Bacteroidia bacterium]
MNTIKEKIITLPNGLRVTYKYVPHTRLVHCGYVIDVGGRDDREMETGMSHFIEHLIFKGTQKRKTFHILNYLESVGGDVNAYTSKEKTCVYASLASEYFERAVDVLTDIVFCSTFPEKEMAKERQVIMEEIEMYRDAPDEAIFEDFDLLIFPNHALGLPILGSKESLQHISQQHILDFTKNSYTSDRIVFSIVGNVSEKEVMKWVDKYLAPLEIGKGKATRLAPAPYTANQQIVEIATHQAHEVIGGVACSIYADEYAAFLLLNNILGGPAMNTRLSLNIREKYGWVYNINSFYSPFLDSGIWGIYYACDAGNLEKVRKKVYKELDELRSKKMGTVQFMQAQRQLSGQLLLGNEHLGSQMLGMAKEVLDFDKLIPLEEYLAEIQAITAEQLWEVANVYFEESKLSRLTYLPAEGE